MKSARIIFHVTDIVSNKLLALRIFFGPNKVRKSTLLRDKLEHFFSFYWNCLTTSLRALRDYPPEISTNGFHK